MPRGVNLSTSAEVRPRGFIFRSGEPAPEPSPRVRLGSCDERSTEALVEAGSAVVIGLWNAPLLITHATSPRARQRVRRTGIAATVTGPRAARSGGTHRGGLRTRSRGSGTRVRAAMRPSARCRPPCHTGDRPRPALRPWLDEPTYNVGLIGARTRFRPGQRSTPHRLYLLRGVISCAYGHPMHGECRVSRGHEWRYYACRRCGVPSVPADDAEHVVIAAIKTMTLPPRANDKARAEFARRLGVPAGDLVGAKRRNVRVTMAENVERATRPQLAELIQLLVEPGSSVGANRGRGVHRMDPARSTLLRGGCVGGAPPDGLEPPTQALGRPRSIH